jgi:hypothetical protein
MEIPIKKIKSEVYKKINRMLLNKKETLFTIEIIQYYILFRVFLF